MKEYILPKPSPQLWEELKLKSGLEIHQQLLTDQKLFCHCPARIYTEKHDAEILRHMRPTLSEMGVYDGAALMEFKTKKEILYLLEFSSVCTYEMDDTPPFEINKDAVEIGLEISLLLNCNVIGELHVIRKQYLDGSIPTGFQRTAIVGIEGSVNWGKGNIRIAQVSIEEDACREVSDKRHRIIFRTDRLSTPLAEIVTYADFHTPEAVGEGSFQLGRLLRVTGKVNRGPGAQRQDVNVSIEGGDRVEIKGVPSFKLIPDLVAWEAIRQKSLLDLKQEVIAKFGSVNSIKFQRINVSDILNYIEAPWAAQAREKNWSLCGLVVHGFKSFLNWPVGPTRTFASEVEGRVRVIACLDESPIIIHNFNSINCGIPHKTWKIIKARAKAKGDEGIILVWGPQEDVNTALTEIETRIKEIEIGVIKETRQVLPNGETDFERILPGADRMYPDTDSPPLSIEDNLINKISSQLPHLPWEREKKLQQAGYSLTGSMIIALTPYYHMALNIVNEKGNPKKGEEFLLKTLPLMKKKGIKIEELPKDKLEYLMNLYSNKTILNDMVYPLIKKLTAGKEITFIQDCDLEKIVFQYLISIPKPKSKKRESIIRYYMGQVLDKLRGEVRSDKVLTIIEHLI